MLSRLTTTPEYSIEPNLSPDVTSYSIHVPYSVGSIDVNVTKANPDAYWGYDDDTVNQRTYAELTYVCSEANPPVQKFEGTADKTNSDVYTVVLDAFHDCIGAVLRFGIYYGGAYTAYVIKFYRVQNA